MRTTKWLTMTSLLSAFCAVLLYTAAQAAVNQNADTTAAKPVPTEQAGDKTTAAEAPPDPATVIVARVNGVAITMAPVIEEMNKTAQRIQRRKGRMPLNEETAAIQQQAIDQQIFLELAHGYGKEHFTIKPEEIDASVAKLKERLSHLYEEYLTDKGFTEDSIRGEIEKRLLITKAFEQEVDAKSGFDEKEARKEYDAKPELFTIPARIEVDDVLVPFVQPPAAVATVATKDEAADQQDAVDQAGNAADQVAAETKAKGLAAQLTTLKSVEKLAARDKEGVTISTVTLFEDKDGDLFPAVSALEPEGVSDVVQLNDGYHVLVVRQKNATEIIPFDKTLKWFQQQAKQKRAKEWFASLKQGAKIEMLLEQPQDEKKD